MVGHIFKKWLSKQKSILSCPWIIASFQKGNDTMSAKKHKANFLLSQFISSQQYFNYNLTPYEMMILLIICKYLDMPNGRCFGKQETLAKECLMSVRQFRISCQKLINHQIIERTLKGKLYNYYLGSNVTKLS